MLAWRELPLKPWYLFRPDQILRRRTAPVRSEVTLPWGLSLEVHGQDLIGAAIRRTRIYDILLTEALFRLTRPGDTCLDIGANVGYAASAMAFRAGPSGSVVAAEPNPAVVKILRSNAERWKLLAVAPVRAEAVAVSEMHGTAQFSVPDDANTGAGTIKAQPNADTIEVPTVRLSDLSANANLMKIDVEGHELSALRGAGDLLSGQGLRDIVFEELAEAPSPVTCLLTDSGYTVFRLDQTALGPALEHDLARPTTLKWEPANYVATREPDKVARRFQTRGWTCLRPRARMVATR